jgi:hypothetical protein
MAEKSGCYVLTVDIDTGEAKVTMPDRDSYNINQMAEVIDVLVAQLVAFSKTFWDLGTILSAVEEEWKDVDYLFVSSDRKETLVN